MDRQQVETGHTEAINDISVDSLGHRAATCSHDRTIRIWNLLEGGSMQFAACLDSLEAPAVQIAWSPAWAKNDMALLTSGHTDGTIMVWQDVHGQNAWTPVYSTPMPSPATSLSWAPPEFGQMFAAGCADGKIYLFSLRAENIEWTITTVGEHPGGCASVSWSPYLPPGALSALPITNTQQAPASQMQPVTPVPRLVSCGGMERTLRVWRFMPNDQHWVWEELSLDPSLAATGGGPAPVWREVAWAPNMGLPVTYIAAGSDEGIVAIWSQDSLDGRWRSTLLPPFEEAVGRLSWSPIGTFLLVSCANSTATMWKEDSTGEWGLASTLSDS